MKYSSYITLFLFAVVAIGCGDNIKLGGRVAFSDNGEPLQTGTVVFVNDTSQAIGAIQEDGTYVVSYSGNSDGLPKGNYKVYIADAVLITGGGLDPNTGAFLPQYETPLIDKKLTNVQTSDLNIHVDGSFKKFDIQVERFKK
ncbi:MAG: hypothetical protein LBT05_09830 [Planctomycetaceae bacterium]|jgi:hypothetical protein|nr:hypothetical protein [Planctomycetaceae bacterium]